MKQNLYVNRLFIRKSHLIVSFYVNQSKTKGVYRLDYMENYKVNLVTLFTGKRQTIT